MKKTLAVVLTLVLMMSALPLGLFTLTASAATSGTTGDCTWSLNGTVLTISGNGAMGDYYMNGVDEEGSYYDDPAPWGTDITEVIINEGVTNIGAKAFKECRSLTSVIIPDSVTSVEYYAFEGCGKLASVTLPDSVVGISNGAFYYCTELTSITLPNGVKYIGDNAFEGCYKITSITIPESVISIGEGAFWFCSGLTSVTIPDSVTSIGSLAFAVCTSLTSITIPDSVTSIGNSAFAVCTSLISINIPDSVTSIESSAFQECTSLVSVTLPNSVTSIGNSAFAYCTSLETVYYDGSKSDWETISISSNNDPLLNADIKYSHSMVSEGSIRTESGSGDSYRSAGVRYKGRLSKEMHDKATEVGFVAVPTAFLNGMTIEKYMESEGNVAISAKVKANGMEDKIYDATTDSNGKTHYDYQMLIKGLTKENGSNNLLDTEITVAMYVVVDGEKTYTETMAYSYNYILSLMNAQ